LGYKKETGIISFMQGSIKNIGIVGTGVMGTGIAEVMARANYSVFLLGRNPAKCSSSLEKIRTNLQNDYFNNKLSRKEASQILSKITIATIRDFSLIDLVIETLSEDMNVKRKLFKKLDAITKKTCIFASNTSSISISLLAEMTIRPRRVIGMHFMNPPQSVSLIELICGKKTSPNTLSAVQKVAKRIKRHPIIKSSDISGFIVNRILLVAINEAAKVVESGIAEVKDINSSVILAAGSGKAMPILELADLIGIDVCVSILNVLKRRFGRNYTPANILKKMVTNNTIGKKNGSGFLEYKIKKCRKKNIK
jgi:3-hydroxybutyryl-CoA dehydrogenase